MSDPEVQRDLGRIEATQDAQELRLANIEHKVDQLLAFMQTAKGGWKMLVAVGAIAGTCGALFAKLLPFWFVK